jgi:hypothetical protein
LVKAIVLIYPEKQYQNLYLGGHGPGESHATDEKNFNRGWARMNG